MLAAQERLKELGYMTTTPGRQLRAGHVDGGEAVPVPQRLIVDGFLGPSTRTALNSQEAVPNGLSLGDQGESVERVQKLLSQYGYLSSSNVTGYFGEVTEKAVKSFQKSNGLADDGSVGVLTMAKLTGDGAKKSSGSSSSGSSSSGGSTVSGSGASTLISIASSKIGAPYVYGAKGPNSFDCSGFVYWCLNQAGVRQSYVTSSRCEISAGIRRSQISTA